MTQRVFENTTNTVATATSYLGVKITLKLKSKNERMQSFNLAKFSFKVLFLWWLLSTEKLGYSAKKNDFPK
jgi:hypothetical protein